MHYLLYWKFSMVAEAAEQYFLIEISLRAFHGMKKYLITGFIEVLYYLNI